MDYWYWENEMNTDNKLEIKCQQLSSTAILPTYGSTYSAGADLYANIDNKNKLIFIKPHETVKIGTGWAFEPPKGYMGLIFARSGLATKHGLRPANCVGVCDEDYRGEYIVALHNDSEHEEMVCHGDRIAQLIFIPYIQMSYTIVNELNNTERGSGGFGSTGV